MATAPDRASRGDGWPEDHGWVLVGERTPDPEDAVHDGQIDCDSAFDVLALSDDEVLALSRPATPFEVLTAMSRDAGAFDPVLLRRFIQVLGGRNLLARR